MAVLDLAENIYDAIEKGDLSVGLFLDLSKAFDTIDHEILFHKLYFYGIRGVALDWLRNYLYERKQYVCINGKESSKEIINHGVPQGSILGPLLYIIYMKNVVNSSNIFKKVLFADDTNLLLSHKDPLVLQLIANKEIEKVNLWLKCNKLSLNTKKTNFIVFRSKK